MIPDTLTAFAAGATIATLTIGPWAGIKLFQARRDIATLAEARDLNAAATLRIKASNRRTAERATVIDTANRMRAEHGMDPIEISPADEVAPKEAGSGGVPRLARGKQSGGTS